MPPTGDLAYNSCKCPDYESNWGPLGLQAGTHSTEPHQPGLNYIFKFYIMEMSNIYKISNIYKSRVDGTLMY